AGFDQTHIGKMPRFQPKVNLVIEGDGEKLFSQEYSWDAPAEQLNIDLSNVRELVIRVESLGVAKGILEHFALGDAQVIK
ncbi:NPCBM/NEW2 domain-containing protein, partial [bacterium]|nr:NPCBM/NEW2 domain-containing protein [bacterium]